MNDPSRHWHFVLFCAASSLVSEPLLAYQLSFLFYFSWHMQPSHFRCEQQSLRMFSCRRKVQLSRRAIFPFFVLLYRIGFPLQCSYYSFPALIWCQRFESRCLLLLSHCLGGYFEGKIYYENDRDKEEARIHGIEDFEKMVYEIHCREDKERDK